MSDFNIQSYLVKIDTSQGKKDYLPLQGRLLWFTGEVTEYVIETDIVLLDIDKEISVERMVWSPEKHQKVPVTKMARGVAVYHATLAIYKDGHLVKKVPGDKMETAADFPDYLEKAQSGAIGRCLMFAGYGTAFAIELAEGERIVDSPVDRKPAPQSNTQQDIADRSVGFVEEDQPDGQPPITEQQLSSIRKLCGYLGKTEPEGLESMSNVEGKAVIKDLTEKYRYMRKVEGN